MSECDREASVMWGPWPTVRCCAVEKKKEEYRQQRSFSVQWGVRMIVSDEIKSTVEEAFFKCFILHPVAEFAYRSYANKKKVSHNVQFRGRHLSPVPRCKLRCIIP